MLHVIAKFRDASSATPSTNPNFLPRAIRTALATWRPPTPPLVLVNNDATLPFEGTTEPTNPRTFDINVAKQKLLDAGYLAQRQAGQRLDSKEQKVISLKLVMPDSSPTYPQIAQFIEALFSLLGIKVSSSVIEENTLYDVMTPPEYDPSGTADYDRFVLVVVRQPGPERAAPDHEVGCVGGVRCSLWCHPPYDDLYDRQNVAPNDQ